MKTLVHSSPIGALEIPTVLGVIEPGAPFDVDDDIADSLLEQTDLYQLAVKPKPPRTRKTTGKKPAAIANAEGADA